MRLFHRHEFTPRAYKMPRPEGGTYYQLGCSCGRRKGERQFKPKPYFSPSVLFTVRVPLDLMPSLEAKADARNEAPTTYIDRVVKRDLMVPTDYDG